MMQLFDVQGVCNQCGLCCMVGEFRCQHLEVVGTLGQPMATRCKVYDERYPFMPIIMKGPDNEIQLAVCTNGTELEGPTILERGIGKGCSMTVVPRC